MIREVLTEKVTSEQRLQRGARAIARKSVLARGSRRCKEPQGSGLAGSLETTRQPIVSEEERKRG